MATTYIEPKEETELIQDIILANGKQFALFLDGTGHGLVKKENVLTVEISKNYEYPGISITKAGASDTNFLGDVGVIDNKLGVEQPTTMTIKCATRKNITKFYNGKVYRNASLVRLMRDIVKRIMFQNKDYTDPSRPGMIIAINSLTGDSEGEGMVITSPFYAATLNYMVTFELKMEEEDT